MRAVQRGARDLQRCHDLRRMRFQHVGILHRPRMPAQRDAVPARDDVDVQVEHGLPGGSAVAEADRQ